MGPESPSEYNLALHSLNARTTYKILMGHLSYLFRIHWNEKIGSYFEKSENINIQLLMIALERAMKIYVYILIGCHNFKPRNFKPFAFQAYFELLPSGVTSDTRGNSGQSVTVIFNFPTFKLKFNKLIKGLITWFFSSNALQCLLLLAVWPNTWAMIGNWGVFPPITLSECPCTLGVKIVDYLQILMLADLFSVYTAKNAQKIKLKSHKVDENLWKVSSVRSNPELK